MLPPGAPPGASYHCVAKDCTFTITAASSAAAIAEAALLTESQLGMAELAHRKSHTGVLPGRVKLSHCDHIKRQMSLLHFNLNSCGSTTVVAFAAGASKKEKVAMNSTLEDYKSLYRFRTSGKEREKKAPGNVVRHLLWTPCLMLALVDARWGPPETAAEKAAAEAVAETTARGADLATDSELPPPAPAPKPPPAPTPAPTHGMDLQALLAASLPPPPEAPSTTPPPPAEQLHDDDLDPADEEEDDCEGTPDVCGTRLTCLRAVHALLALQLELHQPWEDDVAGVNRRERAPIANRKGRAWANSLRKHSNGTCGHYYMHLAFEHLGELIEEHAPFQHGNDAILEKGNLDMKRYRDMTFHGGDSSKEAQAKGIEQVRWRLVSEASAGTEAVYEHYTVQTARAEASWIACFKMEVAADIIRGQRPHEAQLLAAQGKRKASKLYRDAKRDRVKQETVAAVVRNVKSRIAAECS